MDDELYLAHIGVAHDENPPGPGSGRYAWGTGENPNQREPFSTGFYRTMKAEGLSDKEIIQTYRDLGYRDMEIARQLKKAKVPETDIAEAFGMKTTQLRAQMTIDRQEQWRQDSLRAVALKNQGYSNVEIGKMMGRNESQIRNFLSADAQMRNDKLTETSNDLKKYVDDVKYLDIGPGEELYLGVTANKMKNAVAILEEQGYKRMQVYVDQMGTNQKTAIQVLAPEGTTYKELYSHLEDIKTIEEAKGITRDIGDITNYGIEYPTSVSMDRVKVRWAEENGIDQDGVIELRRGVEDISLGGSQYAQVRIAVDDKYYLKGMARYSDGSDMPDGVDIIFNTNKSSVDPLTGKKLEPQDAMKPMKKDPDNPFGAAIMKEDGEIIGQRHYIDKDGNDKLSPINKVNEEGSWSEWSKNIASQVLSKQPVIVAKTQLDLAYAEALDEFNEIKALTNPTVKKKLLESFADDCDASAVHLKAAGLPRQGTHVLLPVPSMKPTEIYAPNYDNGEQVVLIRYPHGGKFEMPMLTVNNKNKEANSFMHNAKDAVGISPKTAQILSGADFDGDTVLVIPVVDASGKRLNALQTAKPLKGLEDFDPKAYKLPKGHPDYEVKNQTKQTEMGKVTNLITDMTIKGATPDEIARAVRHSMVVIDSEKHHLDYKLSAKVERIAELKKKYQGAENAGASTIISRASAEIRVTPRKYDYHPDEKTGRKTFKEVPETYIGKDGKEHQRTVKITRMQNELETTGDARNLMSGTHHEGYPIERVYADYANKRYALANEARKEAMATKNLEYNPLAKKKYAAEVKSLNDKVLVAKSNAPRERKAQIIANEIVKAKYKEGLLTTAEEKKKAKGQALVTGRTRAGAKKERVDITDREWEAIQAGAISDTKLKAILDNADLDKIKKLATPRTASELSDAKKGRIKALSNAGYSTRDIAKAVGVSTSTVSKYI